MVGLVALDDRHGGSVLLDSLAELLTELLVGDSLMVQVDLPHAVDLLVGVVDIVNLVDKPRVALYVWILQGHGLSALQRQDEVFGVEHVQHRPLFRSVDLGHVAAGLRDGRRHLLHLGSDIGVDHLLIAAQLGRMISADALVII